MLLESEGNCSERAFGQVWHATKEVDAVMSRVPLAFVQDEELKTKDALAVQTEDLKSEDAKAVCVSEVDREEKKPGTDSPRRSVVGHVA